MNSMPLYVVVDTTTGQWLTGPVPEQDARSLARLSGQTIEEVEN